MRTPLPRVGHTNISFSFSESCTLLMISAIAIFPWLRKVVSMSLVSFAMLVNNFVTVAQFVWYASMLWVCKKLFRPLQKIIITARFSYNCIPKLHPSHLHSSLQYIRIKFVVSSNALFLQMIKNNEQFFGCCCCYLCGYSVLCCWWVN